MVYAFLKRIIRAPQKWSWRTVGGFPIPPAAGRVSRNREFQSGRGFQSRIWKPFRDLELRLKKKGLVVLHKAVPARHPRKRLHAEPRAVVTPELGCPADLWMSAPYCNHHCVHLSCFCDSRHVCKRQNKLSSTTFTRIGNV